MNPTLRVLIPCAFFAASSLAFAVDQPARPDARLEQARLAVASMRETASDIARMEKSAMAARDPVRLNHIHDAALRIGVLVDVANHALSDLRVAITDREPVEALDEELQIIMVAKSKVESARKVVVEWIVNAGKASEIVRETQFGDAVDALDAAMATFNQASPTIFLAGPTPNASQQCAPFCCSGCTNPPPQTGN